MVPDASPESAEAYNGTGSGFDAGPRGEGGELSSTEPVAPNIGPFPGDETPPNQQVPKGDSEGLARTLAATGGDGPPSAGPIPPEGADAADVIAPATEAQVETRTKTGILQEGTETLGAKLELEEEGGVPGGSGGAEKRAPPGTASRGGGDDATVDTTASAERGQEAVAVAAGDGDDRPETLPRDKKSERVPPLDRGGRPRGSEKDQQGPKALSAAAEKPGPRAEIVCWKEGWRWAIGVEVSQESVDLSRLRVTHHGTSLSGDESRQGRWCLARMGGTVGVRLGGDDENDIIEIDLNRHLDRCLLFKLVGKSKNQGRLVRRPTSGSFLAVVPTDWRRDEELAGSAPYGAEEVSLDGYQAHFFELEPDNPWRIAFLTGEGRHVVVEGSTARFGLIGKELEDASEGMGPLFGGELPRLRSQSVEGWKDVGTVVVGEEGEKRERRGWRTEWSPGGEDPEVEFPSSVARRAAGWFFIRIYDRQNDLIESLAFRFVKALKGICIAPHPLLPGRDGHAPVQVDFLYEPGCSVRLADKRADALRVEVENGSATVIIPPGPAWDETQWVVGPKAGPKAEATVLLERVWWAVVEDGTENLPPEWNDTLLPMPRSYFAATSKRAVCIRLPRPRWIREVRSGFDLTRSRPHRLQITVGHVTIPLREFRDSIEVEDREGQHFLKVWVPSPPNGAEWCEQTVGILAREVRQARTIPPKVINVAPACIAGVLTRLRQVTTGAAHELLAQVYDKRPRRRGRRRAAPADFRPEALCTIALVLELRDRGSGAPALRKRWVERARCAAEEFPAIMEGLRRRFEALALRKARGGRCRV